MSGHTKHHHRRAKLAIGVLVTALWLAAGISLVITSAVRFDWVGVGICVAAILLYLPTVMDRIRSHVREYRAAW